MGIDEVGIDKVGIDEVGINPEDQVFKAMKTLAIREENTMVARVTLHNMRQDCNEPVCAFRARLRGQASVCKFTQKCMGCEARSQEEGMPSLWHQVQLL